MRACWESSPLRGGLLRWALLILAAPGDFFARGTLSEVRSQGLVEFICALKPIVRIFGDQSIDDIGECS